MVKLPRVIRGDGVQEGDTTLDGQSISMEIVTTDENDNPLSVSWTIGEEKAELSPSDLIVVMR